VGIGTTSPAGNLEITGFKSSPSTDPLLLLSNTANPVTDAYMVRAFSDADNNGAGKREEFFLRSDGLAYFRGNVGIGTTSPGEPLSVSSSSVFSTVLSLNNTSVGGGKWGLTSEGSSGTVGAFSIYDYASSLTRLTINASGNVGIGTTNPTVHSATNSALVIRGAGTSRGIIELHDGGGTGKAVFQQVANTTYIGNLAGAGDLILLTNGTGTSAAESMVIKANGDVGINTTSPAVKLEVAGASNVKAQLIQTSTLSKLKLINNSMALGNLTDLALEFSPAGSGAPYSSITSGWITDTSTSFLTFNTTNNGGSTLPERMRIDASGNVGIGVTPSARNNTRLQIVDGIGFPATQVASSDANTLDDYEEGNWTPTFSGAGTPSYTVQYGRYTKIGRIVYCSIAIRATSVTGGSVINIDGLPFSAAEAGDTGQRQSYSPFLGGHVAGLSDATGRFRINGSSLQGVKGSTTTTFMTAAEFSSGGSPQITGDFWYYV
jgi:hypothetical protein